MVAKRGFYAALILVAVAAVFYGVSRLQVRRSYRFPARVVRDSTIYRRQTAAANSTGEDAQSETTTPISGAVKITTLSNLHHWLLDALRRKSSRQRLDTVFELGKTLGAQDFDHAMTLAKQIPVEWMRSVLSAGICFARGRDHQEQAIQELEDGDYRDAFTVGGTWVGWANANPQAALAAARKENDEGHTRLVFAARGFEDLDAMLANANAMPSGETSFMDWAKADPERATEYAMTLDEKLRATVLERIAHGWASNWSEKYRADFMSYLSIALEHGSDDFLSRSIMIWWGQYDPQQAIEYAATSDPEGRDDRLSQVLYGWVQSDAGQAIDWLKTYSAQHDDRTAADLVRALGEMGDPETAARVLNEIPSLEASRDGIVKQWMEWDPASAYDWIAAKQTPRYELLQYALGAGVSLAIWNIDEALDWARQRSDVSLQASALSGVAFVAAYSDEEPANDWISALPPGADRDRCVAAYVIGALEHAKGVTEPNEYILRNSTANLTDLAKAIQDSTLDAAGKQRLLGLIYGWPAKS